MAIELTDEQVSSRLPMLGVGWEIKNNRLQKTWALGSFTEAINFVQLVAEIAERLDHHPDILISYRQVTLTCWTHDAGGLTSLDFDLGRDVEQSWENSKKTDLNSLVKSR